MTLSLAVILHVTKNLICWIWILDCVYVWQHMLCVSAHITWCVFQYAEPQNKHDHELLLHYYYITTNTF